MVKKIKFLLLFHLLTFSPLLFSQEIKSLDESLFIGLNFGYLNDSKTTTGDVETDFEIKDSAYSYDVEFGYRYDETYFYSINHTRGKFDTHKYDNLYITANYNFDINSSKFSPYIGIAGGWSRLTWVDNPVEASPESETKSSNYLVGLQIGLEHVVADRFTLYTSYMYSYSPQKTLLHDDGEISYDNTHNFVVGFRYYFYTKDVGKLSDGTRHNDGDNL